MAIHNRHDFHAFSAFGGADFCPTTFGHNKGRVDEAFFLVQRASVAYPQHRFKHTTGWNWLAAGSTIGDMLLRKMIADAFPLLVRQPNHSTFIADRSQSAILR